MEITLNTTQTTTDDLTAFSAEYEEWNKLVEQNMEWEQPENKEVDAWGLPRQPVDNCTRENWNPSDAEVTKFWKEFWEGVMKV